VWIAQLVQEALDQQARSALPSRRPAFLPSHSPG
jgi:hypothetical protein